MKILKHAGILKHLTSNLTKRHPLRLWEFSRKICLRHPISPYYFEKKGDLPSFSENFSDISQKSIYDISISFTPF